MIEQKYIDAFLKGSFTKHALGKHLDVFKAFVDGGKLEFNHGAGWTNSTNPRFSGDFQYRVKQPEPQPLDIPWGYVHTAINYAAMDEDGRIFFYSGKPSIGVSRWSYKDCSCYPLPLLMVIKKDQVTDWKLTLTERPKGV